MSPVQTSWNHEPAARELVGRTLGAARAFGGAMGAARAFGGAMGAARAFGGAMRPISAVQSGFDGPADFRIRGVEGGLMQIGILGPLSVRAGELSYTPTAPKQRKLLALLTVNAGRFVPSAVLIEELWGEDPPVSAMTTLQTYVLQLRKALGRALGVGPGVVADQVLVTELCGYVLLPRDVEFDVLVYQRFVEAGRAAALERDDGQASACFRFALDQWRGAALAAVPVGSVLERHVSRLEESRLATLERRIEADLSLGRHHELLSELAGLVAEHPMHENLYGQFMVALYRSGRRSDALEVFRRLRMRLVEQLGLEPSMTLARLHQAMLASHSALDAGVSGSAASFLLDRLSLA